MKFALVLLIVSVVLGCVLSCSDKEFADFKIEFNKSYATQEENILRKEIFCKNLKSIKEHNEEYEKGLISYSQGINAFADRTHEEIKGMMGLRLP